MSAADGQSVVGKVVTALVATAVVVAAMLYLSGVFRRDVIRPPVSPQARQPTAATRPAGFARVTVQRVARPKLAEVVGSVQAEMRTSVSSRLLANIVSMAVRAGDRVKKDDVLVELDDRDLRARVNMAKEALRAAEAMRDLARTEKDRHEQMFAQKVASPAEVDQWRSKFASAVADVARAQQVVSEAEVALSDARLRSPLTGIVIDRQAEPGDQASPGRPLLTVYDPDRLRLEASVREAYIGHLRTGQEIQVLIEAIGQQRAGIVQEIVPAADTASRSFLVKVHLTDPSGLYPGMFGRMRLPLGQEQRLEIPRAALEEVGQVWLVRTVDAHGHAERRAVRLGQAHGDRVEVLAGLREGDIVLARRE